MRLLNLFNMHQKAQLKTQEMAFMLMAVVILFILAGLFFMIIKSRDMYKTATLLEREKSLSTLTKIADTAEFSCGQPLCIDMDKALMMKGRKAYANFFPVTSLTIIKLLPKQENVECNEENYPNCTSIKVYDQKVENEETLSSFVSLCRQERDENGYSYERCELGKIIAGFEVKQSKS